MPEEWPGIAGVDREDGALMGNRKLPFGYRMTMGEIVLHPAEAELVEKIFRQYTGGASLNEVAAVLCQQEIPYYKGRLWNKNMVARILEDERYIGTKECPQIIMPEQFQAVSNKRRQKSSLPQKTPAQKVLRILCGVPVTGRIERGVISLLNGLIEAPDRIKWSPNKPMSMTKAQAELDALLDQQPVDENRAKRLIFQTVSEQYEAIGNQEYETQKLRRLFTSAEKSNELNAELLRSTVAEVLVTSKEVKLRLKNGQMIGGRDSDAG